MLVLQAPTSLSASTYKRVECGKGDQNSNGECKFKEHLKASQTKEFRGHCIDSKGNSSIPNAQDCNRNTHQNTCTHVFDPDNLGKSDMSCSCTNWDPSTGHNVYVKLNCDN